MNSRVGKQDFFRTRGMLMQAIAANKADGDFHRSSGRTLATGFTLISKCLTSYNEWHEVVDHHPSAVTNRSLLSIVFNIVDELDLKGFYYRKLDNKIIFDLKQEFAQTERTTNLARLGN